VWSSLPKIAFYSSIHQNELDRVLRDLDTVGLIRRQARPGKNTTVTHLFIEPVTDGEDWQSRELKKLYELMEPSDDGAPEAAIPTSVPAAQAAAAATADRIPALPPTPPPLPPAPATDITETEKQALLGVILRLNVPCLATAEAQGTLTGTFFPQMLRLVASLNRKEQAWITLYTLFNCIANDNTPTGTNIKILLRKVEKAGPYLLKCLPNWIATYDEPIEQLYMIGWIRGSFQRVFGQKIMEDRLPEMVALAGAPIRLLGLLRAIIEYEEAANTGVTKPGTWISTLKDANGDAANIIIHQLPQWLAQFELKIETFVSERSGRVSGVKTSQPIQAVAPRPPAHSEIDNVPFPTPRLTSQTKPVDDIDDVETEDAETEDDQIYSDEDRAYNQMTDDPRW